MRHRPTTARRGDRGCPDEVACFDLRSHPLRAAAHQLYWRLGFAASDTTVFRRIANPP
jgi:hypothetical protein